MTFSLYILIVIALIGLFLIWIFWSSIIGAGFQPTSKKLVKQMLDMAEVGTGDIVYDLGSGDGRIVINAVKKYNAKAVGLEADPSRVFWSRLVITLSGIGNRAKIVWGNFFNQNISEATVVTLFLSDTANQKLKSKFLEELKPGTRIVSYVWKFRGWKPVKADETEEIYLYVIGQSNLSLKERDIRYY
ncbi:MULTISPECIES: class I SAM-dependent methyltransferase [Methanobacterium]|jgi:predicted RNA methylase|uniref:Class I SAM-dependent methyltransferase n=1 Tax=Methanobacterium veterum TaxID=408577 RepID=A0A9E5DQG5_9EURY|nr:MULTISPECIES: class I SAM-dependent methyltransferase [Methanobacterium]MCZ3367384.1 class I SAM-dependent methyltransferase [Methanobacterium veterum]MCZ3373468.1 class I SAM-dependent methyltransferase [Methanobacterium veterum]